MRPSLSRPSSLGLAGLALAAALAALPADAGAADGAAADAALADLVRLAAADQPGAATGGRQGTSAAEPEAASDGGRDPEPQMAADTEAAPVPPPVVYWYDAPCAADPYRPGLSSRLEAARRDLDDSARFPPAPPLDWRYDPQTGQYYYREDGRWIPSGRSTGWYDRYGTWHPDPSWFDGRYRPERYRYSHRYYRYGAVPRPLRPRAPCPCEDW